VTRRATGVAFAFAAALISGGAIYVNAHAVKHFGNATVYTTAKNGVAGVLLVALALAPRRQISTVLRGRTPLALVAVAVIGGSVPFVLFFEGLARSEATQAAFIQKTLIIWVALLAVPLLHERFGLPHALAVVLLVVGQAALAGQLGTVAVGSGEVMILMATLLWSVEVVFVKYLLAWIDPRTLAAARMALGTLLLIVWLAVTGRVDDLTRLGTSQWLWVLLTGVLLTGYVATWYAALARAQAIDVTAVLVFGAVVTALLSGAVDGTSIDLTGTILVTAGTALVVLLALKRPHREAVTA
jgi:drug/metabolite transporter (DMT)-like permease